MTITGDTVHTMNNILGTTMDVLLLIHVLALHWFVISLRNRLNRAEEPET